MKRLRVIVAIFGAIIHVIALAGYAWQLSEGFSLWFGWIFLAHVIGALAWGYGATVFLPVGFQRAWWFTAGPALLFPVLGPVTSYVLARLLSRPPIDRSARRYIIWNEEIREGLSDALPAGAAGQSIVEILQSPRTQLRRNAILALRELDPQLAIPLLRKGLQDSDEQVRIYAQNILSTMLERYETSIKDLAQRVAAEPGAALHAVRLAEQYHELVYLDVAGDDETAAHYLNQALTLLTRAAELSPADSEIPFLGLRCAIRARNLPEAERWFARLEHVAYDIRQVLPWRMELVYMQGDWARLRELCAIFQRSQMVNPRIDELVRFWTQPTGRAA